MQDKYDVIIVGGGLAGLTAANLLSKNNIDVLLVEKNQYPFHKVCGEYISNEVLALFEHIGLNIKDLDPSFINRLNITAPSGRSLTAKLSLGGFGISRYTLDNALYELAIKNNARVLQNTRVQSISFKNNEFSIQLDNRNILRSKMVIGSYGKRELLDKRLNRDFIKKQTGHMAVKYHVKTDYPGDQIGLYLFKSGYCGLSRIEKGKYSLCYLTKRANMNGLKSIKEMEEKVLYENTELRQIFESSEFIYPKPEVINEISFAKKSPVEEHILMCGDTAGLITPLCGNGMAMAMQAAQIACDMILKYKTNEKDIIALEERALMENEYARKWRSEFERRLLTGKVLQSIFNNTILLNIMFPILNTFPQLKKSIIERTHG